MKKKWALLLAAVMALQPLSALTVVAEEAEAPETNVTVYADVYGIEVDFAEVPQEADLENLTLLKGDGEEAVTVIWAEGESGTKRTINVALDTDTKYKLSFGESEKTFQVKTLFAENFDDADVFADANVLDTEPSTFSNSYGEFEVNYGTYGAFIKDGKVWVTDGTFQITALDTNLDYKNSTFTADIKGYAKNYWGGLRENQWKVPALNQTDAYMYSRVKSETANSVGIHLKNDKYYVGTEATGINYENDETFTFGEFVSVDQNAEELGVKVNIDSALNPDASSSERKISVRANDEQVTTFIQNDVYSSTVTETSAGAFAIYGDKQTVAVIDNVKITTYTESVESALSGTLSVEDITYDYDKIVIDFDESIAEVGPISRDKIKVYQDTSTEAMAITTSVDTEDNTKLIIVPTGYVADHSYTVVVPAGFGTPTLATDAPWDETFNLNSIPIVVTDAEFTLEGLLFTFDTDLTDITDQTDLDSITLEIDGVAVATADRTITKDAKTLLIMPNTPTDYAVGKVYKVTIPQGFGTPNIYLKEQKVFEETFTAIPLEMVSFGGNKGFIEIGFSEEVPATANLSGITIRETGTDALVTSAASIVNGKLRVDIPSMVRDTVYEVYVPQGFGTETMATSKSLLKKFAQQTILYQNFDNDGQAIGGLDSVGGSAVTDPLNPTNKIMFLSGSSELSTPAVEALENYTFEFDQQEFYPVGNTRGSNSGEYDFNYYYFNSIQFNHVPSATAADKNNMVSFSFKENAITVTETYGSGTSTSSVTKLNHTHTVHGDAYKSGGNYIIFNDGDAFPEDVVVKTKAGERVYNSTRPVLPATHYEVVKSGNVFTITRDNSQSFTMTATNHTGKTGKIRWNSVGICYTAMDNIRVSAIKLIDEPQVVATELTSNLVLGEGGTSSQSTLSGTFNLKNYTDETKHVRAVVVAYGEDSEMLCANMISLTQVPAGEAERGTITFDLDNCTGTKTIKLFLWDDLAHKTKIANYDFPTS